MKVRRQPKNGGVGLIWPKCKPDVRVLGEALCGGGWSCLNTMLERLDSSPERGVPTEV